MAINKNILLEDDDEDTVTVHKTTKSKSSKKEKVHVPTPCNVKISKNAPSQGPWRVGVNQETNETVFVDESEGFYYYPETNKVYDKEGREVKNYEKRYGRLKNAILSIINSFREPEKINYVSANGNPMYEYERIEENQEVMDKLAEEVRRNPLPLTYKGQSVYDKKSGKRLYINLVDIERNDTKPGLWTAVFEFEGDRKTQACSITRKFLERGKSEEFPQGFPREYWDTKVKKGKNLRGFATLTAIVDSITIELKCVIPPYMRRYGNPQKPSRKNSKRSNEDDEDVDDEVDTKKRRKKNLEEEMEDGTVTSFLHR